MNESPTPNSPEDQLPQEVVAALRQRNAPPSAVPDSVENTILADVTAHFSQISEPKPVPQKSRRFAWVAWSSGTLAAAVLLFAVIPSKPQPGNTRSISFSAVETAGSSMEELLRGDIDQSGDINILDAFALARSIEAGSNELPGWDQNGDGITDRADINLIAQNAVTL